MWDLGVRRQHCQRQHCQRQHCQQYGACNMLHVDDKNGRFKPCYQKQSSSFPADLAEVTQPSAH